MSDSTQKKVVFTAEDKNVSSFMSKVRSDSKKMFDEQLSNAKKLTSETKDQIKFLREYITELQRKNKLENDARRASIAQRMQYGGEKEQFSAREDQAALRGTAATQSATVGTLKEMLNEMKKGSDLSPQKKKNMFAEVFSATVSAGVFRDVIGMARQMPNARTGAEMISPMLSMLGAGTGGAIGAAIDAANVSVLGNKMGDIHASSVLSALGKEAGGFVGDAYYRSLQERSRLAGAQGRLRGLNIGGNVPDLSQYGYDYTTTAGMQEQLFRSAGGRTDVRDLTRRSAQLSRAYTLDQGLIAQYYGGVRSTGAMPSIENILGRGKAEGVRQLDYNRLLEQMANLTQQAIQTSGNVNTSGLAKTMFAFNRLDGQFNVSNPMSTGLISSIAQSIGSPSNPMFQAMNYALLRKRTPNASAVSMFETMQNPLSHPEFIKDVIDDIKQRGGNRDFQTFALASRLGLTDNISAASRVLNMDFSAAGKSSEDLKTEMKALSVQNTAPFDINQAKITNAFVESFTGGIAEVSKLFTTQMMKAIEDIVKGGGKVSRKVHGSTASW